MTITIMNGIVKSFKLRRERRRGFSSSGAINVIIRGALITVLLNFTLLLRRTRTVF